MNLAEELEFFQRMAAKEWGAPRDGRHAHLNWCSTEEAEEYRMMFVRDAALLSMLIWNLGEKEVKV